MKYKKLAITATALFLSNNVSAATILLSDDFEMGNINNWTESGRRGGSYTTGVVSRYGSQMGYVKKDGFTEVVLGNSFNFSTDLNFKFDMEVNSYSNAGSTSSLYGSAGAQFTFFDLSGSYLGGMTYGNASTTYIASVASTSPNGAYVQVAENVFQNYSLDMNDIVSQLSIPVGNIARVDFGFIAYSSYSGGGGEVFFDNVTVSAVPVPAAVWLFGSGLIGLIGIARRKAA